MADNEYMMGYLSGQNDNRGCNNGGLFGGGWEGIIGLVVILALLGGGLGWGGGFGGCGGGAGMQGMATRADINAGFQFNDLQNGIRGIERGLCDGFYGVQNGLNGIRHQISDCCCATQRAIDGVNYNMATQFANLNNTICGSTRDIIDSQNAGTRAILDFLTQDKIATLTAENQSLKFAASQSAQNAFITANQEAQTAELIRRLGRDCPVPAYVVPNPNCCYGNPLGVGYGYGNGYSRDGGCGCGC